MGRNDLSSEGLRVEIGLPSAIILVMGGIVGVGIFVNPAVVARSVHSPWLMLSAWVLGGVIALLGAFVYAELAARIPSTGGEYVYLRDTYGPLAAFLFGWTTLLVVQAGGQAAVAIVFAQNLDVLFGGVLSQRAVVIGALAGLAAVNCLGVKSGNGVQGLLGLLKLVGIGAVIVAGLTLTRLPHPPLAAVGRAAPVDDLKAFGGAMIPVVFSYGGWQTANYVAGEVRDSRRNMARALIGGVLAVIVLYLLVNVACLRALGPAALAATRTPASDVLRAAAGPLGAKLAAGAIALSAIAFMSQGMLTGPRVTFAMARDGLFFRRMATIGATSRAPAAAIAAQAAWTAVLALSGSYERILSYVIAMNFLFFGLTASCVFVLRRREARMRAASGHDGYRAHWHPASTAVFILACLLVVLASFWSYPRDSLIGYGILLLGLPPYLYWRARRRHQTAKEPSR